MTNVSCALYREDLAFIHHAGFGDFARAVGPELTRLLRAAGIRGGTLVDLACGSGIWAQLAQRHGFKVVGVDQSAAMLRLARQVAPGARLHRTSLHRFKLPPCDAVTSIGEGLNYLSPNERPARRLESLFARIAKALWPGGVLIFDVMVLGPKRLSYRRWREGKDWAILTEVGEKGRLLTRRMVTFRKSQGRWRRGEETHRIQLFGRAEVLHALRRAGFSARVARRYGDYSLLPRRLAFIAHRQ